MVKGTGSWWELVGVENVQCAERKCCGQMETLENGDPSA